MADFQEDFSNGSEFEDDQDNSIKDKLSESTANDDVSIMANDDVSISQGPTTVISGERLRRARSKKTRRTTKQRSRMQMPKPMQKGGTPTMPDETEVTRRFMEVIKTMDLPPDSLDAIYGYSLEKKWLMVCDHSQGTNSSKSPDYYKEKFTLLVKKRRGFKELGSTLKSLEITIRTANISWVQEFLSTRINGLQLLVDVMHLLQSIYKNHWKAERSVSPDFTLQGIPDTTSLATISDVPSNRAIGRRMSLHRRFTFKTPRSNNTDFAPFEYVGLCHKIILAIRALMNSNVGFNAVIDHPSCINYLAACFPDTGPRTQSLVLELLAAMCVVQGLHARVVEAMDFVQKMFGETHRFELLTKAFTRPPTNVQESEFFVDFEVACMNFINIVVHSAEDLNFRVHLQYEFTQLGLDDHLNSLLGSQNLPPQMEKQIIAYTENYFDVGALIMTFENRTSTLDQNLQEENVKLQHQLVESENQAASRIAELEKTLADMRRTIEMLTETTKTEPSELSSKPEENKQESASASKSSALRSEEKKPTTPESSAKPSNDGPAAAPPSAPAPPPPGAPAPPPPAPGIPGAPGAPPPPALGGRLTVGGAKMDLQRLGLKQKSAIQTKYRLPALNWQQIRPNNLQDTIFCQLNEEYLYQKIDFDLFEEKFKSKNQPSEENSRSQEAQLAKLKEAAKKGPKILDANRAKNLGIVRKRLGLSGKEVAENISRLNLKGLPEDLLDQLLRLAPTPQEVKAFERAEQANKLKSMSDDDEFMYEMIQVPRLIPKLRVMSYMVGFTGMMERIKPQLDALLAASNAVLSSQGLKKLFEMVLAFGNYTTSAKRGVTYGFKLSSLEGVLFVKSTDGMMNLLSYMVQIIVEDMPEAGNFIKELLFVEKASTVVLEMIGSEISQLVNGLMLVRAEGTKDPSHKELQTFLEHAKQAVPRLEEDFAIVKDAFAKVSKYVGETGKGTTPGQVFGPLAVFIKEFKKEEADYLKRKTQKTIKKVQKKDVKQSDSQSRVPRPGFSLPDGTLDEIISGHKNVAFRAGRTHAFAQ